MSWFQSTNLATFAKSALKEAQKTIDKALDIKEEDGGNSSSQTGGNSGVSNAVTDMASEFLSSWGVAGVTASKPVVSENQDSDCMTSSIAQLSSDSQPNLPVSTISNPTSNVDSADTADTPSHTLPLSISYSTNYSDSLTSNVPVTLLASSLLVSSDDSNERHNEGRTISYNSDSKHVRSLSDTVFHSTDNIGDLVEVLDDTSTAACLVEFPVSVSSSVFRKTEDLTDSAGFQIDKLQNLTSHTDQKQTQATFEERNSSELLHEIDLGAGVVLLEENFEDNPAIKSVISTSIVRNNDKPLQTTNVIESSLSLSDGWDWASGTESCLVAVTETEPDDKGIVEHFTNKELLNPDNVNTFKDCGKEGIGEVDVIHCSLLEQDALSFEKVPGIAIARGTINNQESNRKDSRKPATTSPTSKHLSSSRSVSPREAEETPPSSARVSPNFEMVSSGCVVGSTQAESSRSSSIVVVSGRESTPNSAGSGAGSSGSSEGGHDVEGEIPQSPTQTTVNSTSLAFPRIKHKKGTSSSSSSSDIEVIPSDYSSSSGSGVSHPVKLQNILSCQSTATQTYRVERKESEVQTETEQTSLPSDTHDLSKLVTTEVADILAEKEQEVQQLRDEGEKLSIKQFELGQVIKKLRSKEKETEGVVKGLRAEIATKNLELEKLMKTFISKEGIEQSQNDTISKLNQERCKLELMAEQLSSELEDAKDNVESMKATVENASIEILELKNVISSVQRESAEVDRLTRDKAELISRVDSLQKEVDHLRSALNSTQSFHNSREAELKSQISQLTQKVHILETRLADISSEVADATMPLSMEIEKLQVELKHQQTQSDRREQNFSSMISELELKLKHSSEREKSAKDSQIQFQSKHSTLELKIEELQVQSRSLLEQLNQKEEIFGKKMEDKVRRCQKQEKTVERLTGELERLSNENDALSSELKAERSSCEVERRRSQTLVDQLNRTNNQQSQSQHRRTNSLSTTASTGHANAQNIRNDKSPRSRDHSPSEHSITSETSYLDEVFDLNGGMMLMMNNGNNNRSLTPKSVFDSFSSVGLLESLQNQLRLREGEVISFQEELSKNEKIRKQLNEEIANLTMQNQQLAVEIEKMAEMEQKLEELDKNYNAVLQMYGEKVEEADELRMDLYDVKEMYKAQIEQLLKKS